MRRRAAGGAEGTIDEETADGGSFRSQVKRAGRYILDGMIMLRAAMGCLTVLLILILVCCILSFIFLGFDLKSDLTTSIKLVIEEPPADGGDGIDGENGTPAPTCSDGNPCTVDFEREQGGCESIPQPSGTPCDSPCASFEGTCRLVELQKGITKPMCTGGCRGFCLSQGNCPQILGAQPCNPVCDFGGSTQLGKTCYDATVITKDCRSRACFYSGPVPRSPANPSAPHFIKEDIPFFDCQNNEWFRNYCMSLISDDEPFKECLVPVVECLEELRVLSSDFNDDDEGNDVYVTPPQCHYHFWCSQTPMIPETAPQGD